MVNKALLEASKAIDAARAEEKKVQQVEIAARAISSKFPHRTFLKSNEPLFYSTLDEQVYELSVHEVWKNKQCEFVLCDKTYAAADPSYNDSCEVCKETNDWGNPCRPKTMGFQVIYAHSAEGKTGVSATTGKEFKFHTTVLLPINPGKAGSNLEALRVFHGKGDLKPGKFVFEIKKTGKGKEDTIYHPPIKVHDSDLGDEFDRNSEEAKAAQAKYKAMSEDEKLQGVLFNLKNVKYDLWGIDEPVADVVESKDESTTKPAEKKSKDALT